MKDQCELCKDYSNECKDVIICEACVENAASYGITAVERNDLLRANENAATICKQVEAFISDAISLASDPGTLSILQIATNRQATAIGILKAAKECLVVKTARF